MQLEVPAPARLSALQPMRRWSLRHVVVAIAAAVAVALLIGVPTDVIPNPVFGRPVPVTWWSYPTLVVTALLGGLLAATYVNDARARDLGTIGDATEAADVDTPTRRGGVAGLLSFFAVGCPVCNKVVVVALGTTGARQWFGPVQPLLAIASIVLLAWAVRARLRSSTACSFAA